MDPDTSGAPQWYREDTRNFLRSFRFFKCLVSGPTTLRDETHDLLGFFPETSLMLGFWLFFQRISERGNAVDTVRLAEYFDDGNVLEDQVWP